MITKSNLACRLAVEIVPQPEVGSEKCKAGEPTVTDKRWQTAQAPVGGRRGPVAVRVTRGQRCEKGVRGEASICGGAVGRRSTTAYGKYACESPTRPLPWLGADTLENSGKPHARICSYSPSRGFLPEIPKFTVPFWAAQL